MDLLLEGMRNRCKNGMGNNEYGIVTKTVARCTINNIARGCARGSRVWERGPTPLRRHSLFQAHANYNYFATGHFPFGYPLRMVSKNQSLPMFLNSPSIAGVFCAVCKAFIRVSVSNCWRWLISPEMASSLLSNRCPVNLAIESMQPLTTLKCLTARASFIVSIYWEISHLQQLDTETLMNALQTAQKTPSIDAEYKLIDDWRGISMDDWFLETGRKG